MVPVGTYSKSSFENRESTSSRGRRRKSAPNRNSRRARTQHDDDRAKLSDIWEVHNKVIDEGVKRRSSTIRKSSTIRRSRTESRRRITEATKSLRIKHKPFPTRHVSRPQTRCCQRHWRKGSTGSGVARSQKPELSFLRN
jgi:hypothetical protein